MSSHCGKGRFLIQVVNYEGVIIINYIFRLFLTGRDEERSRPVRLEGCHAMVML